MVALGVLLALGLPGGCTSRVVEDDSSDGGSGGSGSQTSVDGGSAGGGGYISSCLSAGTRVTTPHGARAIEELVAGDRVLSLDHETGELRENAITAIRQAHRPVGEVRIPGGGSLLATEEHPFFDASTGRYVESARIDAETALVVLSHADVPALLRAEGALDSFVAEPYRPNVSEAEVYDLTVERDHNYFAEGVLVHNKTGGSPPAPAGVCTHGLASAVVEVCSGPVAASFTPSSVNPLWVTWLESEPNPGPGGAGGAGSGEDTIVVAFEVCASVYGFPDWAPAFSPFVQPHQEVQVGVSHTGPCTSPVMTPRTANELGAVGASTGWVHVEIPVNEFECLYLAKDADFGYCP